MTPGCKDCMNHENVSSCESAAVGSQYPELPSLMKCETLLKETTKTESTMKVTVYKHIIEESETSIIPLDLNKGASSLQQENISKEGLSVANVHLVPLELTKKEEKKQRYQTEKRQKCNYIKTNNVKCWNLSMGNGRSNECTKFQRCSKKCTCYH